MSLEKFKNLLLRSFKQFLPYRPEKDDWQGGGPKRRHYRHFLKGLDHYSIEIEEQSFPLINLSAGGTCIKSTEKFFSLAYLDKKPMDARLVLLGEVVPLVVTIRYVQSDLIGLMFEESKELSDFLQPKIYFLDGGLRMKAISKGDAPSYFQSPHWNSYSSLNGIIQGHVSLNRGVELKEVNFSYLDSFVREYVVFSSRKISVAARPRRKLSEEDKIRILRNTIFIILGFRQIGKTDLFDQLLDAASRAVLKGN